MYLTQRIEQIVGDALEEFLATENKGHEISIVPDLELPKRAEHGDFALSVAMKLAPVLRRAPMQIAEEISRRIPAGGGIIAKVEIAKPGFINLHVNPRELASVIEQIFEMHEEYGSVDVGKDEKVLVEFVSANPTGPLHLGHCRNAVVGDSLSRILNYAGYRAEREYYFNDAGVQMINLGKSLRARYLQQLGKDVPVPEDGYHGEYLVDIAEKLVQDKGDSLADSEDVESFILYAGNVILDLIKHDLADLRVEFDHYVDESDLHAEGKVDAVLEELKSRGMVYEKEGAVWLKSSQFGDEKDRVLVKSDGNKTYLTPDIAYHRAKYLRGYDLLINVFGGDHHGYVPRLKASMETLGFDSERLVCLIIQMVTIKSGGDTARFSKRAGGFITIREMIDELGTDVVRFFFLMRTMGSQMVFDWDLAKDTSANNPEA